MDLMNLLMKEKISSKNEDSILCHDISNEDDNVYENDELSISLMELNEKYFHFVINLILLFLLILPLFFFKNCFIVN